MAEIAVSATFEDPTGRYSGVADLMIRNAIAGFNLWAAYLAPSAGSIEIRFHLVTDYVNRGGGRSLTSVDIGSDLGITVIDFGAAFELRTGIDPNGSDADIEVFFDVDFLTQYYWVDPLDGTPLPPNHSNLVDVIAHEIGHALGFNGLRDWTTGALGNWESVFDKYVRIRDGLPWFEGPAAMAAWGGPIPLTPGNLYHLGAPDGPVPLIDDLMNGVVFNFARYSVSQLDVAVLSDLGVPTVLNDTLIGSSGADTMYGGAGDDRMFGGLSADHIDGGPGSNYLRGEDGDDWVVGGNDTDDCHGNAGNDTVQGGGGDDWVVGGKDDDLLYGEDGHDVCLGNLGNDTIDSGTGNDVVRGGQGDDIVRGGAGDDWVSGDRGTDTLTGGTGADIFHVFDGSGVDRLTDFSIAEGDRVYLLPGTHWSVAQVGADTVVTVTDGEGGQLVLLGVQMSALPEGWIFGA